MRVRSTIATILVNLSIASTLSAQTTVAGAAAGRVFVDGAVMADYDQTDFEPSGPALAAGFGIGARMWQRYSLRFEFDSPGEHLDLEQLDWLEHRFASST